MKTIEWCLKSNNRQVFLYYYRDQSFLRRKGKMTEDLVYYTGLSIITEMIFGVYQGHQVLKLLQFQSS